VKPKRITLNLIIGYGIHLEIAWNYVVNNVDNIIRASHKVKEVEMLVSLQEWKVKHSDTCLIITSLSYTT
jgi:hypothetical protein